MNASIGSGLRAAPNKCPRRAQRLASAAPRPIGRWINLTELHREPFRIFFPAATLAGLIGVALWPLLLLGWMENYPGPSHARLMVQGFFGGFILGFMGTAMPRLVSGHPLSRGETFTLLAFYLGNVVANTFGANTVADGLFAVELGFLFILLRGRCHAGGELPPPSFVLVGLAFAAALVGTALQLAGRRWELNQSLQLLTHLLSYHGFVLLAVLGAGGFLLPRFLGLGSRRNSSDWQSAARVAKGAGALILLTFLLEATGLNRIAVTVRAVVIVAYLAYEMPLERLRLDGRGVRWQLTVGLAFIPVGILAAGWLPAMRATLLHLELVGGFALITLGVGTRVVFGHSGGQERLERFHPWLTAAALLILLGLASRISADFLPGLQLTHYLYGAGCWIGGVVLWAICVLPRVLRPDPET